MSGNLLVRFDEGRVGRTEVSPSLLLYCESAQVRGQKQALTKTQSSQREPGITYLGIATKVQWNAFWQVYSYRQDFVVLSFPF